MNTLIYNLINTLDLHLYTTCLDLHFDLQLDLQLALIYTLP